MGWGRVAVVHASTRVNAVPVIARPVATAKEAGMADSRRGAVLPRRERLVPMALLDLVIALTGWWGA